MKNIITNWKTTCDINGIVFGLEVKEKNEEKGRKQDELYLKLYVQNRFKKMEEVSLKLGWNREEKNITTMKGFVAEKMINQEQNFKGVEVFENTKKVGDKYYKNVYYKWEIK